MHYPTIALLRGSHGLNYEQKQPVKKIEMGLNFVRLWTKVSCIRGLGEIYPENLRIVCAEGKTAQQQPYY